jgi:hypothetical protein
VKFQIQYSMCSDTDTYVKLKYLVTMSSILNIYIDYLVTKEEVGFKLSVAGAVIVDVQKMMWYVV